MNAPNPDETNNPDDASNPDEAMGPGDMDSTSPPPETPDDLGDVTYSPCTRAARVGAFTIELAERFTGVQGQVSSGVVDANVPDEVASEGTCRLLEGRTLFCDPACAGGETCSAEGSCEPYPENVSVGTIAISGMQEGVSIEPRAPINLYTNTGTLPHPGFSPGAELVLSAQGGDLEPFSLHVTGIEALDVSGEAIAVAAGQDAAVTWSAPSELSSAQIHLELNVNNHGSRLAWLECDVEDTGSFALPSSLVDRLLDLGVSGFPTLSIFRRSADSVELEPGCIEFEAISGFDLDVMLEGLTSCTEDDDCPEGQSCQEDLTCQ